jgi:hypothetical protein
MVAREVAVVVAVSVARAVAGSGGEGGRDSGGHRGHGGDGGDSGKGSGKGSGCGGGGGGGGGGGRGCVRGRGRGCVRGGGPGVGTNYLELIALRSQLIEIAIEVYTWNCNSSELQPKELQSLRIAACLVTKPLQGVIDVRTLEVRWGSFSPILI